MKMRSLTLTTIMVGFIVVCLGLAACTGGSADYPAASLQGYLASRLANSELCPTGDTQDVQQIVNSAVAYGIARLPEGCYRITSTIILPPCTSTVSRMFLARRKSQDLRWLA
jgi:hypothetical protein